MTAGAVLERPAARVAMVDLSSADDLVMSGEDDPLSVVWTAERGWEPSPDLLWLLEAPPTVLMCRGKWMPPRDLREIAVRVVCDMLNDDLSAAPDVDGEWVSDRANAVYAFALCSAAKELCAAPDPVAAWPIPERWVSVEGLAPWAYHDQQPLDQVNVPLALASCMRVAEVIRSVEERCFLQDRPTARFPCRYPMTASVDEAFSERHQYRRLYRSLFLPDSSGAYGHDGLMLARAEDKIEFLAHNKRQEMVTLLLALHLMSRADKISDEQKGRAISVLSARVHRPHPFGAIYAEASGECRTLCEDFPSLHTALHPFEFERNNIPRKSTASQEWWMSPDVSQAVGAALRNIYDLPHRDLMNHAKMEMERAWRRHGVWLFD